MQSQDSNDDASVLFKQDQKPANKLKKKSQPLQEMQFNDDDQQEDEFEDSDDGSQQDDDDQDDDSRGPDRKKHKKNKDKKHKKGKKKRKAKKGLAAFFDNQAYESSVDEEQDDDDEFAEAELRNYDAKKKTQEYYKRARKNQGLLELLDGKNEDEVNEIMQRRNYNQYVENLNSSPSAKDPKLYQVPVVKGKEDSLTLAILNKAAQLQNNKEKALAIYSVMSMKRKFPGYVFVEAMSEAAVKQSLEGFLDIMPKDMQEIKDDQYQNLFKEKDSKNTSIREQDYIRIKGGRYDGDLGKVFKARKNGFEVILQPRIDKNKFLNELKYVTDTEEITDKQKAYTRIIKKHFSTKDMVVHRSRQDKIFITADTLPNIQVARKPKLTHEGMIILPYSFDEVTKEVVSITAKEGELFKKDDTLTEFARKELKYFSSTININKGDEVEVIYGDMKGVYGTVKEVLNQVAIIQPKNNPRLGQFQQQIDKLAKKFRLKQMVSVITGNYKDRVGRILKIDNHQATILTENNNEIVVNTNNLKVSDGVFNPQDMVMEFHKNDLVLALGVGDGVGMVLSASRDSLTILDLNNSIRVVSIMDVDKKLDTKNSKAINGYKQEIRQGSIVRIIDGKYGGKKVEIKHVYKTSLFVTSNEIGLHGAHVIKDTNCTLITQSSVKPKFFFNNNNNNQQSNPSGTSNNMINPSKDDELPRGKIITIKSGQYKGYQGQILNCIGEKVEVKLTAKLGKKVMIKRDDIVAQSKGLEYGKTPRVSSSSYVPQLPGGLYESRRDRDHY